MIPDIAVIISAYAVARLACEYLIPDTDQFRPLQGLVAVAAIGVVVVFLISVLSSASDLANL